MSVETLAQLQERFDRETDGVKKAKLMQKLGDAQFDAGARRGQSRATTPAVGLMMEKYRDNVRAAIAALKKAHPDAEKHPQRIQTIGNSRRERDCGKFTTSSCGAGGLSPSHADCGKDLKDMDLELLHLLFPEDPANNRPSSRAHPLARRQNQHRRNSHEKFWHRISLAMCLCGSFHRRRQCAGPAERLPHRIRSRQNPRRRNVNEKINSCSCSLPTTG